MVDSVQAVTDFADTLVIGNGAPEFRAIPDALRPGQVVVDFVRIVDRASSDSYDGICW